MSKVIQVKIHKEDVLEAVRRYIEREVAKACKKQRIQEQIANEVEQATIEITVPDYEERLKKIEFILEQLVKKDA